MSLPCHNCGTAIYKTLGGPWRHEETGDKGCRYGETEARLETAHARHSDPVTSHQAAESVTELRGSQQAVLRVMPQKLGITDEELVAKYRHQAELGDVPHQSDSGIRSRRSELVKKRLVLDSGTRRPTTYGRKAIVWRRV